MVLCTRGRCNDVEQGNIAWTKNPVFRNPDFSGMPMGSMPGQKIFIHVIIPCEGYQDTNGRDSLNFIKK